MTKPLVTMIRSSSPLFLTTLALGVASSPAFGAAAPVVSSPTANQLAQFNPSDRPPPLTADGGGARFSEPDLSAPEGTGSTPTRNSCVAMSPLMPKDANGSYYGLTASDRPELYFYALRAEESRAQRATLYLYEYSAENPAIEPTYEKEFSLPTETRTIVSVGIDPDSEFTLDPSKQYEWYIEIQCKPNSNDPTTLAFTYGWIERTAEDPVGLGTVGTNEAAAAYGEAGIWFEYLDNLIAAGSENWGYILDGFSAAIDDSVDLSRASVTPSPQDPNVQVIQIQPERSR